MYIHIFFTHKMSHRSIKIRKSELDAIFKNLHHGKCFLTTSRTIIKCNYKIVDNHLEVRKLRMTPNHHIFPKVKKIIKTSKFRRKRFTKNHLVDAKTNEIPKESARQCPNYSDNAPEPAEIYRTLNKIKVQNDVLISSLVKKEKLPEANALNRNEVTLVHRSTQYDEGETFHDVAYKTKKKCCLKSLFLCYKT